MSVSKFLVFVFLFFVGEVSAQKDSVLVLFELNDRTYHEGIPNVNGTFVIDQTSFYKRSTSSGQIQFYSRSNSSILYSFNHPMYDSAKGTKKIGNLTNIDTVRITIELTPIRSQNLEQVVVKAPGTPDTIYMSKRLSVADFEVQQNGDLVLLAYPKQLKKGSELILYNGVDVINTFAVPGTAEELVRDYRGNAHVVCADNVYGIHVQKEKIGISTIEKDYYLKYLAPILDTNKSKLYFSNFNTDYPAFSYFSFDQLDSTYRKICNIKDDLMMELYRAEYKWADVRTKLWAKNKEYETGIDAQTWVGASIFTQSIYYKELYAPMFHRNDTLFVFDYYKDVLRSFNALGNPLDSVAIYHHYQPKTTGWKNEVLQDRITGEIYAVFDKAGYSYIGKIDTKTGEIKEKVRLEFRYIDKISVHNNFIYYVYRPYESIQKRFLYRERLPYTNGPAKVPYGTQTSIETGK